MTKPGISPKDGPRPQRWGGDVLEGANVAGEKKAETDREIISVWITYKKILCQINNGNEGVNCKLEIAKCLLLHLKIL